jgi:two-component system sensor histidine kinase KdpD
MEFARKHQITQIVVGSTRRGRWEEMTKGSIVKQILREAAETGTDVHVIARRDAPAEVHDTDGLASES